MCVVTGRVDLPMVAKGAWWEVSLQKLTQVVGASEFPLGCSSHLVLNPREILLVIGIAISFKIQEEINATGRYVVQYDRETGKPR